MKKFSHSHWVKEIGKYIEEDNFENIIKFSLSYTLQSLRANEDIRRFQWNDDRK